MDDADVEEDDADGEEAVSAEDVPCVGGVGDVGAVGGVLRRSFSLRVCISIQKLGTKRVPMKAFIAMPKTTAVPIAIRLLAPGPVANSIGITPNTNASAVIMMGRNRICPASSAAFMIGTPALRKSMAYSTIRMAFLADMPKSRINPICV